MLRKIIKHMTGIHVTAVSLGFLLLSFILSGVGVPLVNNLAWIPTLLSGLPLLWNAVDRLANGKGSTKISPDLLIVIAMTAAVVIGDLFAAGEVAVIMAIGAILEERTVNRAKSGVTRLLSIAPTMGRRMKGEIEEMIPAEQIQVGDLLRVLPGESIPVDGTIVRGETSIDQSILTGESLPAEKIAEDEVFCGTVNRFGAFDFRADHVGEDSCLQRMARMVQETEANKAPTARLVDKYAALMVPASLLIAVATLLITRDFTRSVTVLLVFCPCAMILATPTAVMAAVGQATKRGLIIKSGAALETMGKVDTIAFDKTGTLTWGSLEVSDIISFDDRLKEADILALTASAEANSEHPLGRAVVACAKKNGIPMMESESFVMTAGKGIRARVTGHEVVCGSERCLENEGMAIAPAVYECMERYSCCGKALILIAVDGYVIGLIALSDVIRPTTEPMLRRLFDLEVSSVLLTGDHAAAAEYFACKAGVSKVRSDLLPEEKAACIGEMQEEGHKVCMVGDGVNDAVALKTADVGIAMGGIGSDIAAESADMILMSDDISVLPYLKRLSVATIRTIKLSISAAMLINLCALVLSLLGIMGPTSGALVHNIGSCLVVLFAGLLYDRRFPQEEVINGKKIHCTDCVKHHCATCTQS